MDVREAAGLLALGDDAEQARQARGAARGAEGEPLMTEPTKTDVAEALMRGVIAKVHLKQDRERARALAEEWLEMAAHEWERADKPGESSAFGDHAAIYAHGKARAYEMCARMMLHEIGAPGPERRVPSWRSD